MADSSPQPQRSYGLIKALAFLCLLAILGGLLFPPLSGHSDRKQLMARSDLFGITVAARQYYAEYGKLPQVSPDGRVTTPEQNAHLLRIFQGLEANPKKIVFLDCSKAELRGASPHKKLCCGLDAASGVYLDPWGNPYRIAFAPEGKHSVESPYEDERDIPIPSLVIAWSVGKDGVQSPAHKGIATDDVISWSY